MANAIKSNSKDLIRFHSIERIETKKRKTNQKYNNLRFEKNLIVVSKFIEPLRSISRCVCFYVFTVMASKRLANWFFFSVRAIKFNGGAMCFKTWRDRSRSWEKHKHHAYCTIRANAHTHPLRFGDRNI